MATVDVQHSNRDWDNGDVLVGVNGEALLFYAGQAWTPRAAIQAGLRVVAHRSGVETLAELAAYRTWAEAISPWRVGFLPLLFGRARRVFAVFRR